MQEHDMIRIGAATGACRTALVERRRTSATVAVGTHSGGDTDRDGDGGGGGAAAPPVSTRGAELLGQALHWPERRWRRLALAIARGRRLERRGYTLLPFAARGHQHPTALAEQRYPGCCPVRIYHVALPAGRRPDRLLLWRTRAETLEITVRGYLVEVVRQADGTLAALCDALHPCRAFQTLGHCKHCEACLAAEERREAERSFASAEAALLAEETEESGE